MDKKPKLLLINDDGIEAKGLKHLWNALCKETDTYIVAPHTQRSGTGLAISLHTPLEIHHIPWENDTPAWKINGTPADCVRLALRVLLDTPPDLIVSGINVGSNAGRTVLYSGTIGAVIDGTFRDIPGIAFSSVNVDNDDYTTLEKYIVPIVRHVLEEPLPKGCFLNINFPDHEREIKGFKWARQGRGYWKESPERRLHPEGTPYFWLGGSWDPHEEEELSDVSCLEQGYISCVPIYVDELTDYRVLEQRGHLPISF